MPGYNYSTNASRQNTRDPQKQFLLLGVVLTRIAFDMYTTTANQIMFKIVCVEQTFVLKSFSCIVLVDHSVLCGKYTNEHW